MRVFPVALVLLVFGRFAQAAPLQLPTPATLRSPRDLRDPRIATLQGKIQRARIFAAYDSLIDIYKKNGLYDEAARLEREQVPLYRAKKLEDAAIIHANSAFALQNGLGIYLDTPTSAKDAGPLFTGAALEPVIGCYAGAFIDRDDHLGHTYMDESGQSHHSPAQFSDQAGKNLGSLFMYLHYGQPFPALWVSRLKAAGVVPHIAWEPTDLNQVQDDDYLRRFAADARDADWPVFFRFASEMNGFWTPYHGNPPLYKAKFRLVHRVLHEVAPRVATIWCVNNPPLSNAFDYYPGDDGCDWVGVNFYAVPYHENRTDKPAFDENPLALLDPIYARFAAKKPIAICEFAAAHHSAATSRITADFAIEKLSILYGALPLLYPRVKMVNWFDMNTIRYPTPGKSRNDYVLTENPNVLRAWREATSSPHFLTSYSRLGDALPPVARPLNGQKVSGQVRFRFWAKTFTPRPILCVGLDGKIIYRAQKTGAHTFDVDTSKLKKGRHMLTAYLYDAKKRFQRQVSAPVVAQ